MAHSRKAALVMGFAISALACGNGAGVGASTGALNWATSLDAARSVAAEVKKPVMVEFYASWCGWCKRFESQTLSDERVVKALAAVVPVRLNAEKEGRAEANRLGVRGYPTIVFLAADGREVGRIPGYLDADPFLQELADILKRL